MSDFDRYYEDDEEQSDRWERLRRQERMSEEAADDFCNNPDLD